MPETEAAAAPNDDLAATRRRRRSTRWEHFRRSGRNRMRQSQVTFSAKSYAAYVAAGTPSEQALEAASEIGELAGELRIVRWMVGVSIGLSIAMLAMMFQIALRLP